MAQAHRALLDPGQVGQPIRRGDSDPWAIAVDSLGESPLFYRSDARRIVEPGIAVNMCRTAVLERGETPGRRRRSERAAHGIRPTANWSGASCRRDRRG